MKKVIKAILAIVAIILVLALVFFSVDYTRVKEGKTPMFCINPLGAYLDGGTVEYFGLGYKIIAFHRLGGYNETKIGTWAMQYEDFYDEIDEFETKVIIKSAYLGENEKNLSRKISGIEAEQIEEILDNLKFTKETCDGINDYIITLTHENLSYGIEVETFCHITKEGEEAVLNAEDSYTLISIINNEIYNNTVSTYDGQLKFEQVKFTKTYNVKADLEETNQTNDYNFYVVEQYQMNNPTIIEIEKQYNLEEGSNYEITFEGTKIVGKEYSDKEIFTTFRITNIQKTNKKGMDQTQESI